MMMRGETMIGHGSVASLPLTASPIPAARPQTVATDRFDLWRTMMSQSFVPLEVRTDAPELFHGRMRAQLLDEISVIEVTASGHQVHRSPALIARSDRQYFKLHLQIAGRGMLVQDNREATLGAGDLAVYDTERPYTLAAESDHRAMVFMFPHQSIDVPIESIRELTAVRFGGDDGIGRLLSSFLNRIADDLDLLSGPSGRRLARNTLELATTAFEAELGHRAERHPDPHDQLLASIRRFIEEHLADPELSPAEIAAAHFISTRLLHRLFADGGMTVASWIRARRLEHCRRDLRDPQFSNRPISAIANRWGFVDSAHFSRVFRDSFGEPPSAYRLG